MNEQEHFTQYQQGFNDGYLIAEHMPELSENLSSVKNDTPRITGMQDGRRQFVLERTFEREAQKDRTITSDKGKQYGKDKDIDMER